MKKLFLISSISLLLAGCASDSDNGIAPGNKEEGKRSFLKVSLITPYSSTRAVDPGEYVDGYDYENNVNSVRFYFFDNEGNPCEVFKQSASSSYLPYIDWQPTTPDITEGDSEETVEKVVTATLGINQPANTDRPELVVAIVNPTPQIMSLPVTTTLSQLRGIVSDYNTGLNYDNFVITNSVYVAKDGGIAYATEIEEDNFGMSEDDYEMETLEIYVERVLSRLDLYLQLGNESTVVTPEQGEAYTIYKVSQPTVDGVQEEIYANLLGWNITQTPDASRLIKEINAEWPENLFQTANEPWSVYQYHRSYWAINPPATLFDYLYGTFDGTATDNNGQFATALNLPGNNGAEPVTAYMQENAADDGDASGMGATNPSQVIIAAQLVNAQGQPLQLVRWANRYYTQTSALTAIANILDLWTMTTGDQGTVYSKITPADLKLVSADEIYPDGLPEDVAEYYVYVQLSDTGKEKTWYNGSDDTSVKLTTEQSNTYIQDRANHLMVWNSGLTYYYIDIRHISNSEGAPGYFGVVRNHIYQCNISNIEGLGTPVFNPQEVIHPQKPTYDDSMITAVVKILQWRIVSHNYDIKW